MVKEDYISFDIAKLLKEKGFNEPTLTYYDNDGNRMNSYAFCGDYVLGCFNNMRNEKVNCTAPTHQMVLKWLREKCDIYVEIIVYSIAKPVLYRWCASKNGRVVSDEEKPDTNVVKCFIHGDDTNFTVHYCDYEDAVEAAIKYCLENLV